MKIKNVSNKVIGIAKNVYLMPEEECDLPKELENNGSIKAYQEIGFIKVLKSETREEKIEAKIEVPEENVKEEPKETKKGKK